MLLGNVVDGNVSEAGGLRDELAVHGLADAGGASDEDVGSSALRHGCCCCCCCCRKSKGRNCFVQKVTRIRNIGLSQNYRIGKQLFELTLLDVVADSKISLRLVQGHSRHSSSPKDHELTKLQPPNDFKIRNSDDLHVKILLQYFELIGKHCG